MCGLKLIRRWSHDEMGGGEVGQTVKKLFTRIATTKHSNVWPTLTYVVKDIALLRLFLTLSWSVVHLPPLYCRNILPNILCITQSILQTQYHFIIFNHTVHHYVSVWAFMSLSKMNNISHKPRINYLMMTMTLMTMSPCMTGELTSTCL